MKNYNVIIDRPAHDDIINTMSYIRNSLYDEKAATGFYAELKEKIIGLSDFPEKYACIADEPYAVIGVRRFIVGNYNVFYITDDENKCVHIIRVLYNRMEWQRYITGEDVLQ